MEGSKFYLDESNIDPNTADTQSPPKVIVPICENCNQTKSYAKALQEKHWKLLLQFQRELTLLQMQQVTPSSTDNADVTSILADPCTLENDSGFGMPDEFSDGYSNTLICKNCESIKSHAYKTQDVLLKKAEQAFQEMMALRAQQFSRSIHTITPVQKRIRDLEGLRLKQLMSLVNIGSTEHAGNAIKRSLSELEAVVLNLEDTFKLLLQELRIINRYAHAHETAKASSTNGHTGASGNSAAEEQVQLFEPAPSHSETHGGSIDTLLNELSDAGLGEALDNMVRELPIAELNNLLESSAPELAMEFLLGDGDARHQPIHGDSTEAHEHPYLASRFVTRRPSNLSEGMPPAASLGPLSAAHLPRSASGHHLEVFPALPPPAVSPQFGCYLGECPTDAPAYAPSAVYERVHEMGHERLSVQPLVVVREVDDQHDPPTSASATSDDKGTDVNTSNLIHLEAAGSITESVVEGDIIPDLLCESPLPKDELLAKSLEQKGFDDTEHEAPLSAPAYNDGSVAVIDFAVSNDGTANSGHIASKGEPTEEWVLV